MTESTTLTADRGATVFSDDFHDPLSGWSTATLADGSNAKYTGSGYVVVGRRFFDHVVHAPYGVPQQQLSVSVTATESADSPTGSGFGVGCGRGVSDSTLYYEFIVVVGGTWELLRSDTRAAASPGGILLKKGTSPSAPGATPITVEGMCATLSDGETTRLALFINGANVADITDREAGLSRVGWLGDLVVRGENVAPTTVTATHFAERDLTF